MVETASSEMQSPSQSEALVRRILSVAEILARVSQEAIENEPENPIPPELRYGKSNVSSSEG
ncbi:MAG: hypothetical protein NZM00_05980 [Anaerolinea sp.]|nr:hypothetical protein [Anaerolinea sp.]